MNTFRFCLALFVSAFVVLACGRSSDEIRHAEVHKIPKPQAVPLSGLSLNGTYLAINDSGISSSKRCDILRSVVSSFAEQYLSELKFTWGGCARNYANYFSNSQKAWFSLRGNDGKIFEYGFEVGINFSSSIIISSCDVDTSNLNDVKFSLCGEVDFETVPNNIAKDFPRPSKAIINFFPTIVSVLQ